jgi:hypothetical protein
MRQSKRRDLLKPHRLHFLFVPVCHLSAGDFLYPVRIIGHEGMKRAMRHLAIKFAVREKSATIVAASINRLPQG